MNKKELIRLVKSEASKIRKKATKEEIDNLDFGSLNPDSKSHCVYGLMTGRCTNARSSELIRSCAEKTIIWSCEGGGDITDTGVINGSPKNHIAKEGRQTLEYFSPIEVFILFPKNTSNGNNEKLISYLKGETGELVFKPF